MIPLPLQFKDLSLINAEFVFYRYYAMHDTLIDRESSLTHVGYVVLRHKKLLTARVELGISYQGHSDYRHDEKISVKRSDEFHNQVIQDMATYLELSFGKGWYVEFIDFENADCGGQIEFPIRNYNEDNDPGFEAHYGYARQHGFLSERYPRKWLFSKTKTTIPCRMLRDV